MKQFRVLTQESWGPPPVSKWRSVEAKSIAAAKRLPGVIVIAAYEVS